MRSININLSPEGIDEALALLEEYHKEIKAKAKETIVAIAEDSANTARTQYDMAKAAYDSRDSHEVTVVQPRKKNTVKVRATGNSIAFYEFGSGIFAGQGYPTEFIPDGVDVSPGSWSQSDLGKGHFDLASHPFWWWHHNKYTGVEPYMGMYEASKTARNNAETHIKRIFT